MAVLIGSFLEGVALRTWGVGWVGGAAFAMFVGVVDLEGDSGDGAAGEGWAHDVIEGDPSGLVAVDGVEDVAHLGALKR